LNLLRGWRGLNFAVGAGAGRARVEKSFMPVNECSAKTHELNQLKKCNRCMHKVVCQLALGIVGLQQLLHYDVTTHCCETLAQPLAFW